MFRVIICRKLKGQCNQCQTHGVKFEEIIGRSSKNGKKLEDTEKLKKNKDRKQEETGR